MNKVILIGRTTKDAEIRYTQGENSKAVTTVDLAVSRDFTNGKGQRETDFIRLVIWGKNAETFANHVKKGNKVGVKGRIQTRNFEGQDGKKVYVTEVVVSDFTFMEKKQGQVENQEQK